MQSTAEPLNFRTRLAYGTGATAEGVKTAAFNTFVLYYYNQVLEVSGALTGTALFIALAVDAVSDPLVGAISDRHRSRWGRRHPFIAASALPLALMIYALFNPPEALSEQGLFLWLTATAVGARIGLTLFHVPHLALGAELARDYDERTRLFGVVTLMSLGGAFGTALIGYSVFFPTTEEHAHGLLNPDAYPAFAEAAAIAIFLSIALCTFGTVHRIPTLTVVPSETTRLGLRGFLAELGSVFANPSYRSIFFGLLLGTIVVGVEQAFQTYMGVHFWGLSTEELRLPVLAVIAGLPFALVLAPRMTRRFDKRGALVGSAAITIVVINTPVLLRLSGALPPNGDPLILQLVVTQAFVAGVFGPVILVTINSMFADIADEQELLLDRRQEGVIYAARSFSLKAAGALGAFLGGVGLDLIAFPRGAAPGAVADEVIFRLGLIYGPATSTFTFVGLLLYLGYRLDRARVVEIQGELAQRVRASTS